MMMFEVCHDLYQSMSKRGQCIRLTSSLSTGLMIQNINMFYVMLAYLMVENKILPKYNVLIIAKNNE